MGALPSKKALFVLCGNTKWQTPSQVIAFRQYVLVIKNFNAKPSEFPEVM
jgi:hypothetical protein